MIIYLDLVVFQHRRIFENGVKKLSRWRFFVVVLLKFNFIVNLEYFTFKPLQNVLL
jgi:hypothetical protein